MRRLAVWFVDVIAYAIGSAIDRACELFDLDGEDH
jgi:hypothetical protein